MPDSRLDTSRRSPGRASLDPHALSYAGCEGAERPSWLLCSAPSRSGSRRADRGRRFRPRSTARKGPAVIGGGEKLVPGRESRERRRSRARVGPSRGRLAGSPVPDHRGAVEAGVAIRAPSATLNTRSTNSWLCPRADTSYRLDRRRPRSCRGDIQIRRRYRRDRGTQRAPWRRATPDDARLVHERCGPAADGVHAVPQPRGRRARGDTTRSSRRIDRC